MTVPDVLDRLGHPRGARGRTTCPLHQGDNTQAFSYQETRWYCFVCNEGGNARQLLQRLVPSDFIGLEGVGLGGDPADGAFAILAGFSSGFFKPRRSQILNDKLQERRQAIEAQADAYHRQAIEDWALSERMLRDGIGRWDLVLEFQADALERLWAAEAVTGCDCRTPAISLESSTSTGP